VTVQESSVGRSTVEKVEGGGGGGGEEVIYIYMLIVWPWTILFPNNVVFVDLMFL
jgi:hypothetical protein